MTRGRDQHVGDWDEQRERLSAYLDGELGAEERAALERHLPGCARCQAELADLRGVRALLRALPTPVAPRSFVLPDDGAVPRPIAPAAARRSARRATTGAVARAMEWVGSVAAVAGLVLLLGAALGGGQHGAASTAAGVAQTTATAQTAQQGPKAGTAAADGGGTTGPAQQTPGTVPTPQQTRPSVVTGEGGQRTPSATPGSPATPPAPATTPPSTPASTPHVVGPASHTSVATEERGAAGEALPLAGVGLILGGAALFAGGKAAERRARRRQRQ